MHSWSLYGFECGLGISRAGVATTCEPAWQGLLLQVAMGAQLKPNGPWLGILFPNEIVYRPLYTLEDMLHTSLEHCFSRSGSQTPGSVTMKTIFIVILKCCLLPLRWYSYLTEVQKQWWVKLLASRHESGQWHQTPGSSHDILHCQVQRPVSLQNVPWETVKMTTFIKY